MPPAALVLALTAVLAIGDAASAGLVKKNPGPPVVTAAERTRAEDRLKHLEGEVRRMLSACRGARGLQQRCSCYRRARQLESEVGRETKGPGDSAMARFRVAKEGVKNSNDDKKYQLQRLARLNRMNKALSDHLAQLNGGGRAAGRIQNPRSSAGGAGEEQVSEARCRNVRSLRTPRARLRPPQGAPRPGRTAEDISALTRQALRESYRGRPEELQDRAAKLRRYNESRKKLRGALAQARGHVRASGHRCGPAAPPEIRELCAGIARLERRLREIEGLKPRHVR